ncbi:ATP-binding protein [Chitinophagaceae bacterium LB-8]|uniref:histidine kinase n=1 Tax=Paraflavisolibacter caeni TaxID=2982496 RepID=A0A9X3B9Z0_9BACT|nr:two-component regulator propeller domain-containing protein [Paraflavisolibacter caeni]MCU7552695.1 ATP-binding protein [Paraflavisolibacter caeni]
MHISKAICLFSFFLLFQIHLLGQSYYFRHYSVENGLSNNAVICSLQDKMGFLWFGTKDGLNRFDGYSFKTFRKIAGKPGSIGNNYIHTLFEDKKGTLWVGTEQGLYEYLNSTEEFSLVSATANTYIDKIVEDAKGDLWFISYYKLCRYSKRTKKIEAYDPQSFFVATNFCTTPDGTVWVGTSDGQLKRYHPESNSFSGFDLFGHSKTKGSRWIESLFTTDNGNIVAGTSETEIKIIDPFRLTYTDIALSNSGETNLYIRSIQQTAPDEFWLGTESGVFVYNTKTGKCRHLEKDHNNPYSITDNSIYSICHDREGGVWVGTYFGGINYLSNQPTPFTKYFPGKDENSLSGGVVSEIEKDRYGNLWIGTEDAGLNKLEPATGKFTHFKNDGKAESISFFKIHGLLATGDELWLGTFQHGLDIINIRTGNVIRHFEAGSGGFTHNFIYCIYQTDSGQILIGTPHGVFTYNRKKSKFEFFEGLPPWIWYTTILKDKNGSIWGGTFGNGLHYFNPSTGERRTFMHHEKDPNSLSSNRVNAVFEDSNHNLWIATEEGLCRWNDSNKKFIQYGTANGFPSDFMLSILEDDQHNLWISTTKGLVRFHPSSGEMQVYTVSNGLLSDQFNYNSAFKDKDGRMYFGSAKGLISFHPKEFSKSTFIPPVYITGFLVNNQELSINQNSSPLQQSITYTDEITLTHDQSTFSIDFAALSYTAPEMIQYAYQMEGLSNKWINLKTNRRVYFTELPPGSYTFRVKAFKSGDTWSGKIKKISIRILPPWWASKWAYTIYVLLTLLLIYSIVRYYHKRMNEKNQRKYELLEIEKEKEILKVELAKEKEVLQAKIDFFTNVAHEIRTPLTLIKVPLEKVIKKAGNIPEIENSLKIMDRNANRLIDLTNQLLDFRQTEINKFHLSFEQAEISGLLKEACNGFIPLAEQNDISLSLHLPDAPFLAFVDVDAFNKIIYNLFSNAVKYAQSKIHIILKPYCKNDVSFTIFVKNDGYLIPEQLKEKIFEPFFRIRETESQTGTGIGLALSRSLTQLHNGLLILESPEENMNVFSLTLPVFQETEFLLDNKMPNSE